jgi:hypothetical protein
MGGSGAFSVFVAIHAQDMASRHLMHLSNLAAMAGQNVAKINQQLKIMSGIAAIAIGGVAFGAISHLAIESVAAAQKVERLKLQLQGIGLSSKEIAGVTREVNRLTQLNPNLAAATAYHNFKDSYAVFGNYQESMKMQPYMAKFMVGLKGLYGDRAEEMGWDAQRAAELQLGGHFSAVKMQRYLDSYMRVAWMTGGKVDPQQIHGLMKNMPYSRTAQSPDAIAKMAVLAMEMGGGRAGTGFNAMDRFAIAHMAQQGVSKEKREKWFELGLLENVKRNAKGNISDFTVKNQALYQSDKVEWLFSVLGPAFAKKGVDITKPGSIPQMAQLWSSQTAAGANISTALQQYAVKRHAGMYGESFGTSEAAANYSKSHPGKFDAFFTSLNNLQIALGTALTPLLSQVATGLIPIIQGITQFIREHPRLTQMLTVLGMATAALVTVGGAVLVALGMFGTLGAVIVGAAGMIITAVGLMIVNIANIIANKNHIIAAWESVCSAVASIIYRLVGIVAGAAAMIPGLAHVKYAAMDAAQKGDTSKPVGGHRGHGSTASWGEVPKHKTDASTGGGVNQNIVINIDGSRDTAATQKAVEVAMANAMKNLHTPTSGHTWYQSPNGLMALG